MSVPFKKICLYSSYHNITIKHCLLRLMAGVLCFGRCNQHGNPSLKYSAEVQLDTGRLVATEPAVLKSDSVITVSWTRSAALCICNKVCFLSDSQLRLNPLSQKLFMISVIRGAQTWDLRSLLNLYNMTTSVHNYELYFEE